MSTYNVVTTGPWHGESLSSVTALCNWALLEGQHTCRDAMVRGKNIWEMIFVSQENVRGFCDRSGKVKNDLKSHGIFFK